MLMTRTVQAMCEMPVLIVEDARASGLVIEFFQVKHLKIANSEQAWILPLISYFALCRNLFLVFRLKQK